MADSGGWRVLDAFVRAHGLTIPEPVGGQAYRPGGTTFHGLGRARDYGMAGTPAIQISRLFAPLARGRPDLVPELFGADGVGYDEGRPYQAPGHTGDHTHVAIGAGVTLAQLEAAYAGNPDPAPAAPGDRQPAVDSPAGVTESGLRRLFLVVGGASLFLAGLALLGAEFGAVKTLLKGRLPL